MNSFVLKDLEPLMVAASGFPTSAYTSMRHRNSISVLASICIVPNRQNTQCGRIVHPPHPETTSRAAGQAARALLLRSWVSGYCDPSEGVER
jgi:hypothetical protein